MIQIVFVDSVPTRFSSQMSLLYYIFVFVEISEVF